MSDGEGEDSFWGDRRDRRRRGRRSDSRSPSNRRSPSPTRSPSEKRSEQRRPPSPYHRQSRNRRSPSPPRRHFSQRRGDTPSPSRRPRSPRSSGRYSERAPAARYGDPRYAAHDGPSERKRSPSPHRNSRPQRSTDNSYIRPRSRSRSRDRRSPPPRAQREQRPLPDPMHAPSMIGSRDFRYEFTAVHFASLISSLDSQGVVPQDVCRFVRGRGCHRRCLRCLPQVVRAASSACIFQASLPRGVVTKTVLVMP